MPLLLGVPLWVWATGGSVGVLGFRSVLDGISDTSDRMTPNLLALAGAGIGVAGVVIALKAKK